MIRRRDAPHAVIAAGGQVHSLGRAQQQPAPGRIGRCVPIEQLFAKLKALLRQAAASTGDKLWTTIGRLLGTCLPAECTRLSQPSRLWCHLR
jgi:hypothetical protein